MRCAAYNHSTSGQRRAQQPNIFAPAYPPQVPPCADPGQLVRVQMLEDNAEEIGWQRIHVHLRL